jgi:UDP-N-acetylglucosamine 2-epimerase (non-hydrolysing)
MKIVSVVGARPNFMKIAPFNRAIEDYNKTAKEKIMHILVHTGQHYDSSLSQSFFSALKIPDADVNLHIGSGTHAEQVGNTMITFEKLLKVLKPDWVVVVGDVNATLACSITAKKEHIKVCHIEAGLRSGDMRMPEEINRLVTDRLSDLLLTPDQMSSDNLRKEGVDESKIRFVGNIMIDTLEANKDIAAALSFEDILRNNAMNRIYKKPVDSYALMTMHRPSNVDHKEVLEPLIDFLLNEVAKDQPLIWPMHPRAEKQMKEFQLWDQVFKHPNVVLLKPLGYHPMLKLNMNAKIMLTDSGGLQEECTILGTPCLTLRWNTERPITLRKYGGASILVGNEIEKIRKAYNETLDLDVKPQRPELWDGHTAERCLQAILDADNGL